MRTVRVLVPLLSLSAVGLGFVGSASAETTPANVCAAAATMSTNSVSMPAASSIQTVVRDVRVGHHAGCDRVVFEFAGPMPGYSVRYVPAVIHDGSGQRVSLAGTAFLQVVLRPTATDTAAPQSSISPGFTVLRQVAGAEHFEGVTSYGIGLASREPFLAYRLVNPNRLVIDIASPASAAGTRTAPTTQVSMVPAGGVQTGGGSTAGLQQVGLLAAGGGLILAAGALAARRRVAGQS